MDNLGAVFIAILMILILLVVVGFLHKLRSRVKMLEMRANFTTDAWWFEK